MIVDSIPGGVVRFFARPYVAGDSLREGLETAASLFSAGLLTTLDLLAEDVRSESQVVENYQVYEEMITAIAAAPTYGTRAERPTVSLKPSSFTLRPLDGSPGADACGSAEAITALAETAARHDVGITIDMEDRHWTDFTLDLARRLHAAGHDVGTVLQTRLHRTEHDLAAIPYGMRTRLVIGIYPEPSEVATQSKSEMKERLLRAADFLLRRGAYVELATHDAAVLRRFLTEVVPATGAGVDRFELQLLYGVPVYDLIEEVRSGALYAQDGVPPRMRIYVPFATSWDQATAYCRRRLAENPQLGVYVARNIVRGFVAPRRRVRPSPPPASGHANP
jgi:proline dehydrogenase